MFSTMCYNPSSLFPIGWPSMRLYCFHHLSLWRNQLIDNTVMAGPSSVEPSQTEQAIKLSGPLTPQSAKVTSPRPVLQCFPHPMQPRLSCALTWHQTSVAFDGDCSNTLLTQAPHTQTVISSCRSKEHSRRRAYFRIFTVNRTCLNRLHYEPAGQSQPSEVTFLTWTSGWNSAHSNDEFSNTRSLTGTACIFLSILYILVSSKHWYKYIFMGICGLMKNL